MQVLGLILIGIVIGLLARLILPGRQHIGLLVTILLGVAGALIGGIVASAIGEGDIWELNFVGTVVGIVAAIALIAAAEAAGIGSDRGAPDRRDPDSRDSDRRRRAARRST
jgi:uncharacterized membrane protein YeaQ/YmgE (transglycosylase-associated protein family)